MKITWTNPVWPGYFADPFAWRFEGAYYAVGTGPGEAGRRFPMLRSRDLAHWEPIGHALLPVDPALGDAFWAPEVAFADGRFYLYYSVGHGDKGHHLRVAIADRPEGPYEDVGEPVNDSSTCPFAIDANPFRDDDGQWYLFYARDFLDAENGFRAGTGLAVDRLVGMTKLAGEERVVMRARHDWQRFLADRPMYGGIYDWHTLEGPCALKRNGLYYCLYSAGCWQNESYGVDYAVAESVMGPYQDTGNGEAARILRTIPGRLLGPGHNSVTQAPDGTDLIVYHAWDQTQTARQMHISPLVL